MQLFGKHINTTITTATTMVAVDRIAGTEDKEGVPIS